MITRITEKIKFSTGTYADDLVSLFDTFVSPQTIDKLFVIEKQKKYR